MKEETKKRAAIHFTDEQILKKSLKNELLSTRYRQRVAKFVTSMAKNPIHTTDKYNETWERKNNNNMSV